MPSVERLAASLSAAVGVQVELTRPSDAAHGDFATNAALPLAGFADADRSNRLG
mgnify:CR=1 FL=1